MSLVHRAFHVEEIELVEHSPARTLTDEEYQERWPTTHALRASSNELPKDEMSSPCDPNRPKSATGFAASPGPLRGLDAAAALERNMSTRHGISINLGQLKDGIAVTSLRSGTGVNPFLDDDGIDYIPHRKPPSKFWDREPLPGECDIGEELGDNAPIWEKYRDSAQEYDKTTTAGWSQAMDVLLVFAALFSGILTAFIIEFYKQLQPDGQSQSVALLVNIAATLQCVMNGTVCADIPAIPSTQSQLSTSFKWINGLWFTSLTLSLSVSALAILVKQWIHAYNSGLTGPPKTYAYIRQFRYNGVKKWHMAGIIAALPTALYLAVLLFFVGLLILLWSLDKVIYKICLTIVVAAGLSYITTTILPLYDPSCPFWTPASHFLDKIYQVILHYTAQSWYLSKCGILIVLTHVCNWILSYSPIPWVLQVKFTLLKRYIEVQIFLKKKLQLTCQSQREQRHIHSEISGLNADALLWLSNTSVQDTQHLVTQAISGLDLNIVTKQFFGSFTGLHWPSQFLVETFNSPNILSPGYHEKLACYAQAYLIIAQMDHDWPLSPQETQIICDAIQWYPILIPIRSQTGIPKIPVEHLQYCLSELGQSLRIVTHSRMINMQCFQIVIHLLLHSITTMYVLYSESSAVQSQILENCFETLQIWLNEQNILQQQPLPCFLQSLCTILQVFTGVTQTSALQSIWSRDRQEERTWILLLKGLVSHSSMGEQGFQPWRVLHCALTKCYKLLSEDRMTLESVLGVFLDASPVKKEAWSTKDEGEGYPFLCLNIISPLFTSQDTLAIIQSFDRPWSVTTGTQLSTFLQKQCEALAHAQSLLTSETLEWLLEHVSLCRSFPALRAMSVALETLSKSSYISILDVIQQHNFLQTINDMLCHEIQDQVLESWNHNQWGAVYSFAASCNMLYQAYKEYIISSGILITLHHLSIFLSTSEYAYMKEAQNFMHIILNLEEAPTFETET